MFERPRCLQTRCDQYFIVVSMSHSAGPRYYNMDHRNRGKAIIFNQMNFDKGLKLEKRHGTDVDAKNLDITLTSLGFEVQVYQDQSFRKIMKVLKCAAEEDHRQDDCILIAVLTHGRKGTLCARDQSYKPASLWKKFTADVCHSLAGKPKIFFIQACRGEKNDFGVTVDAVLSDAAGHSSKIPTHADFIIAYSTVEGFSSWRDTGRGSLFIQELCEVLRKHVRDLDLLTMLTEVCRKVAKHEMDQGMQVTNFTSTLRRSIRF